MEPAISIFFWKNVSYFPSMQNQCHLVATSKTTQAKKKKIFIKIPIASGCTTSYLAILEWVQQAQHPATPYKSLQLSSKVTYKPVPSSLFLVYFNSNKNQDIVQIAFQVKHTLHSCLFMFFVSTLICPLLDHLNFQGF